MVDPSLPLVDLHRHLEGSIRLDTVIELSKKFGLKLPDGGLGGLKSAVWMTEPTSDILQIMPRFDLLRQIIVDYEVCARITFESVEDAVNEGLDYVEIRFSPLFMAELHILDPMRITEAVVEGWREAEQRYPLRSRLVAILSRTYGPVACTEELKPALKYAGKGIIGLDLAGDEYNWPAHQFKDHFARARAAGLKLTAHAGEFAGADSVRDTIDTLAPDRIGHAVHAVDDPEVIELLLEKEITIESCPTSNYYTRSVPSLKAHPLPVFLEKGLSVSLSADDPTLFSGISTRHEYEVAKREMGITVGNLRKMQMDGFLAAFITPKQKSEILERKTGKA